MAKDYGMKFRAHETFFIRKGWISKGIHALKENPEVFITKDVNPTDTLGIGSNMVKSLRYWMQATGITTEPSKGKRTQSFTEFGKLVAEHDPYLEEMGTLFFIHYKIMSQKSLATSWYYFFNLFKACEFTKEDFVKDLNKYILDETGEEGSERSLTDDFNCIIGTYVPRYELNPGKVSPENNIDCPLGELGLIKQIDHTKKIYKKMAPPVSSIDPWIVLAVIMENAGDRSDISLNELLNGVNNIGRVFNLDVVSMIDVLQNAEITGAIKIIRTAGLDIVRLEKKYTFLDCVKNYYRSVENDTLGASING